MRLVWFGYKTETNNVVILSVREAGRPDFTALLLFSYLLNSGLVILRYSDGNEDLLSTSRALLIQTSSLMALLANASVSKQ